MGITTTLGRMLQSAALRSAARKYAHKFGPRLRHDYGAGEHYTAAQIRAAAEKCQLPLDHITIGLAAFMSKDAFADLAGSGDYESLRNLFQRYIRSAPNEAWNPASDRSHVT
jgi:hypothetical protein